MLARRPGVMGLSIALCLVASLSGCRKETAAPVSEARANPAEVKRLADDGRQNLRGLDAPLGVLSAQYRSLHEQFDPLPPGLPGFGETRAKFYSATIGVGTLSAKVPWLNGRLEAAVAAGNLAELQEVTKDVQHTYEEIRQAERIGRELANQAEPFQRLAEQKADELRLTGKAACE